MSIEQQYKDWEYNELVRRMRLAEESEERLRTSINKVISLWDDGQVARAIKTLREVVDNDKN